MDFSMAMEEMEKGMDARLPGWKGWLFMDDGTIHYAGSDDLTEMEWRMEMLNTEWETGITPDSEMARKIGRIETLVNSNVEHGRKIGELQTSITEMQKKIISANKKVMIKVEDAESIMATLVPIIKNEIEFLKENSKKLSDENIKFKRENERLSCTIEKYIKKNEILQSKNAEILKKGTVPVKSTRKKKFCGHESCMLKNIAQHWHYDENTVALNWEKYSSATGKKEKEYIEKKTLNNKKKDKK